MKTTHGYTRNRKTAPEYKAWSNAKSRCFNENFPGYYNYGGRGITMCLEWRLSFNTFLGDMGPRPSNQHSLDRIDNNGNYEPGNCRWVTRDVQSVNRRVNRHITYRDRTLCISEWSVELGVDRKTLEHRINSGWDVMLAFTTPVRSYNPPQVH